jgi:hypothetical protein
MSIRAARETVNIDDDPSIDDLINRIVQLSSLTKSIMETKEKHERF